MLAGMLYSPITMPTIAPVERVDFLAFLPFPLPFPVPVAEGALRV